MRLSSLAVRRRAASLPERERASTLARVTRLKILFTLLAVLTLTLGGAVLAQSAIDHDAKPRMYTDLASVPPKPVAIVFGALVIGNDLSPVLAARVDSGVALYKAGKVKKLLMTGDNDRDDYDEVTPMKAYAVKHGVPAKDVVRDYAGFHTFESCYRARHVFAVTDAVLVTQRFHLPRALYLAKNCGIEAVGYVAPDDMPEPFVRQLESRERLATLGAVLASFLPNHAPRIVGPAEPIFGDERPTR